MHKSLKLVIAALLLIFVVAMVLVIVHLSAFAPRSGGQISVEELGAYLEEQYPNFTAQIDASNATVTLIRELTITHAQAVAHGGNIYADELAPETYLEPARTIAADIAVHAQRTEMKVVLLYRSSDGQDVFSVCSDGTITTCWENE